MSSTGFLYHPDYLRHDTGLGHPERPARLSAIVDRLGSTGLLSEMTRIEPRSASADWAKKVHTAEHVEDIKEKCRRGVVLLEDWETAISRESYDIALLALGGALSAVDAVMNGTVEDAFCAVRPPGHHAGRARAMGFCLFNNVAAAARYVQERYGADRVLIVDWDVHHGNGTQDVFYDDPTVFYFSVHQYPHYPGTGRESEIGTGPGEGYTLNAPVPPGSGDAEYLAAFHEKLIPAAQKFDPDFVLVSAGFDAHRDDPLSATWVSEEGFAQMTEIVEGIARESCGGRLISLLEGGYNLDALARCVERHISVLRD